ncbi:Mycobacterium rhizamassiliense ORFan [Mycobacterium rhizamassiliense]|uniref:Mycobacterium rhizamassiliense ORFan n=1 Tax=Mycobacterium rhizamassiliense TaxID=1841860 RepID=A0A2U3NNI0_9MYCO|nr:hypothetical protein [Mycobacterium rhizamassiliense]SPM33080.1 Mycobacterium rhizamassiliense ORFan [Mycobacterium rhizamassiliense]
MHTITGYGTDAQRDTLAILDRANSAAGAIHLHTFDGAEIVDVVGVVSARPTGVEVALKVGRARRYPGTHCRTCGSEVTSAAVRELVAL